MPANSSSSPAAPAATASKGTSMIARQAIVNAEKAVIGYELFNRSRAPMEHTAATDVLLLFTALSHTGREVLVGTKLLFVNSTHESLAGGHLELLSPEKVVLEVEPLGHVAASEALARLPILRSLRERGFKLSFNHTVLESAYATWLPLADYIKLDMNLLRPEQLAVLTSHAIRHSKAQLVATKIETEEQFTLARSLGAALFQGYWFSRPAVVETKLLAPNQVSIIQLINLLRQQASTDEIEDVLKKDAGLAFNLLRLINSAGFNGSRAITSVRQAIMIMGLKKLFRWSALLLTASQFGTSTPTIGHTAVIRARLMELLAMEFMSGDDAEQAFLVGVFSLLDAMLNMPLTAALQLIRLPDNVRDALLLRQGVFGELLTLAEACESGDDIVFDQAASVLGLNSQQINWAHLQALAWCDQITQ